MISVFCYFPITEIIGVYIYPYLINKMSQHISCSYGMYAYYINSSVLLLVDNKFF